MTLAFGNVFFASVSPVEPWSAVNVVSDVSNASTVPGVVSPSAVATTRAYGT